MYLLFAPEDMRSRKVVMRKVGKYEIGRTIGEGNFAKVKFAQNTETGESVAMKVIDKESILKHKMADQIKREICVMKLVRHHNIVHLYEVLASRTKIYIILEFVTGGELFDKIVHQHRLSENESRTYFQQLIDAVDYCHSKGVYHRDLKPENLLLDSHGNLKISDFGLSALSRHEDGLLHTTCGTPNYVAPEEAYTWMCCSLYTHVELLEGKVLSHNGYDGAVADIWSCGVILYVLMAGFLPFDEEDLTSLYRKINAAEFSCPSWFSLGAKSLITRILDPDPQTRMNISGIRKDDWFKKNYTPARLYEDEDVNLDDVQAVFEDAEEQYVSEQREDRELGPSTLNAFDLITLSQGLNLGALFDRHQDDVKRQTRFISRKPTNVILSKMESAIESMGFRFQICNYKIRAEGLAPNKIGQLVVASEVFEVAPSLYMVEVRKAIGDTLEYHKFYKTLCSHLEDIIWEPVNDTEARNADIE